ncbi:alpha-ribazole phosphatase [Clostridium polyendosporum]|uniref:Alpha-ribazole phosphatase n=1 Tax=Clostridium polyendosporum TaxID=69208 RepID=A0A919S058_9CLOT|nr:histidine phosphatase family protein [Clostridium polyendosporum]GIM28178.1 alpha-ribazole phosphatase [Clostridium polyendosporum]
MKLILIRHGETEGNARGIYQGSLDLSLNRQGETQCLEIKEKLREFNIDKVFSSPLKRAVESAEVIFKLDIDEDKNLIRKKNYPPIIKIEEFKEINFGLWEGKCYKQISSEFKDHYESFLSDYKAFVFPQGESFKEFYSRVASGLQDIRDVCKDEETVAIVAHGGTLKVILCELLGLGENGFYSFNVYHGCYSFLSLYGNTVVVERINK